MKKLVKSTLHHGYEANFLLTLMSGQGGPSFSCKWSWKPTSFTAYERLKVYLIFFPSKQSRCNAAPILLKPSCQAVLHFSFHYSSLFISCYFNIVVRNDLNFFTRFPFFLSWWQLFIFYPFLLCYFQAGAATLHTFLRCCVMYVYMPVWKWEKPWNDFPILLPGNRCKQNTWL